MSNVLQSLFARGEGPLADQFRRWRLWNSWEQVVGPNMAKYTTPVGYSNGTLVVWVQTPVHMQELSFGLDFLRERVNSSVGFNWVHRIRLTLDRKDVPQVQNAPTNIREYLD